MNFIIRSEIHDLFPHVSHFKHAVEHICYAHEEKNALSFVETSFQKYTEMFIIK